MPTLPPFRPTVILHVIWLALVYALLAKISLDFYASNHVVSMIWPPSGWALAVLLMGGRRYWPAVTLGALLGNLMAGSSFAVSLMIGFGNTLEAVLTCTLLTRSPSFNADRLDSRHYWHLLATGAVGALVSASVGVATLWFSGIVETAWLFSNVLTWWQGDVLGIAMVTPLLLVWRKWPTDWPESGRLFEGIVCFGLAFIVGQSVFFEWYRPLVGNIRGFVMFCFVSWAAARLGRHGALLMIAMIALQVLLSAVQGVGYFGDAIAHGEMTGLWLYLFIMAMVGVDLASVIDENRRVAAQNQRTQCLYRALSEINQAIVRLESSAELFPLVCRCSVELGGMSAAWVAEYDRVTERFRIVATDAAKLKDASIRFSNDDDFAMRLLHDVLRTPQWRVIDDLSQEAALAPRPASAKGSKYRGSFAAFPIPRAGKPFAVLVVYQLKPHAFDDKTLDLLNEMSRDIAFALDNVDREFERKLNEESLQLAASVYETTSEAIMVTDADNRIIAVNPAFCEITGYPRGDILGCKPNILKSDRHDSAFYKAMWHAILRTGRWQGEIWDRRKNGEIYPKWLMINTVFNSDGSVRHRIALFTDITQKKRAEELIWQQANFDPLTGLPNRGMFQDRFYQEIKKANRSGLPLALLFVDLDHFKEVNDTLGHGVGDILLQEAASRLTHCVRESDTVARFGGDEFTIILSELRDPASATRTAQDILRELSRPFQLINETTYISASIGISLYPDDAQSVEALLKSSDQAMYQAKEAGRNRFRYFTSALQEQAQKRMAMATELRGALAQHQFSLVYQPIVELASGAVVKAEALLRWQHPVLGRVSPVEFVPVAEKTGLIVDIGEWVFREVVTRAKHWRDVVDPRFQISINKSPVQFYSTDDAVCSWSGYAKEAGLPGDAIVVEITEGLLLDIRPAVTEKLFEFRDAGIQVAIDDFGTGYSSLSYLKKFDIDYLKIDRSFVSNLTPDSDDMALCEAIIVMAHKLRIKVIAEGIETDEQCRLLTQAGCDYGQGYLFSQPLAADGFERYLQDRALQ